MYGERVETFAKVSGKLNVDVIVMNIQSAVGLLHAKLWFSEEVEMIKLGTNDFIKINHTDAHLKVQDP